MKGGLQLIHLNIYRAKSQPVRTNALAMIEGNGFDSAEAGPSGWQTSGKRSEDQLGRRRLSDTSNSRYETILSGSEGRGHLVSVLITHSAGLFAA